MEPIYQPSPPLVGGSGDLFCREEGEEEELEQEEDAWEYVYSNMVDSPVLTERPKPKPTEPP